ncbi:unnamed protein product, partial [Musa textilis]
WDLEALNPIAPPLPPSPVHLSFSSPYGRSNPPNPHTFNPLRRLFPTRRAVPRRSRLQAPFKPNPLRIDCAVENSHEKKKK